MDFLTQLDHNFIDVNVLFFIQEYLRFEWMTPIWKFITWLGDAGCFWIALSVNPADSEKNEKDRCGGVDLPFDRCADHQCSVEKSGCPDQAV